MRCQALPYDNHLRTAYPLRMQTFGARLRAARQLRGLSQEALGLELGVTKATVSNWENDRDNPSFQYLAALAEKTRASLDYLILGASDAMRAQGIKRVLEGREDYETSRDIGRAQDPLELALLLAFRVLSEARRKALLAFIKPD